VNFLTFKPHHFFEANFTFLDHFHVNLLILITSWSILAVFEGFLENLRNPRWRIQDGRRLRTKRYCDGI